MRTLIIALQSLDKENLGITTMEILIETIKKSFSVAFNFVCGAKILWKIQTAKFRNVDVLLLAYLFRELNFSCWLYHYYSGQLQFESGQFLKLYWNCFQRRSKLSWGFMHQFNDIVQNINESRYNISSVVSIKLFFSLKMKIGYLYLFYQQIVSVFPMTYMHAYGIYKINFYIQTEFKNNLFIEIVIKVTKDQGEWSKFLLIHVQLYAWFPGNCYACICDVNLYES